MVRAWQAQRPGLKKWSPKIGAYSHKHFSHWREPESIPSALSPHPIQTDRWLILGGGKEASLRSLWRSLYHTSVRAYVQVPSPATAVTCVVVQGLGYNQRPCECLGSVLSPEAIVTFVVRVAKGPVWVDEANAACVLAQSVPSASNKGHGDILGLLCCMKPSISVGCAPDCCGWPS